jgi:DNA-binding response OmpR family regulator
MLQGARILIVDDERTTRLSLSEIFSLRGANTATAVDGNDALAQIQQTAFDLIILDVKMPGLSGLQVLEYVQLHAPGTVCILLTAHATIDSAIRALRQGAFDYVLKPAQPKTIIEAVERGLAKRQDFMRRQNLVDLMEQTVEAFKAGTPPPIAPAPASKPSSPILNTGNLTVDLHRREARQDDRVLDLTPTEFDTWYILFRTQNESSAVVIWSRPSTAMIRRRTPLVPSCVSTFIACARKSRWMLPTPNVS